MDDDCEVEEIFAQVPSIDLDPGQVNLLLSTLKPVNQTDDDVGKFEDSNNFDEADYDPQSSGRPKTLILRNDVTEDLSPNNRLVLNMSPLLNTTPPPPSSNVSLQKCCRCDFFSLSREGLQKHESVDHPPPRPTIQCISCPNIFLSLQSLKVHLLLDHEVLKSELTAILLLTLRKCEEFLMSSNTSDCNNKQRTTRKDDSINNNQNFNSVSNVMIELPPSLNPQHSDVSASFLTENIINSKPLTSTSDIVPLEFIEPNPVTTSAPNLYINPKPFTKTSFPQSPHISDANINNSSSIISPHIQINPKSIAITSSQYSSQRLINPKFFTSNHSLNSDPKMLKNSINSIPQLEINQSVISTNLSAYKQSIPISSSNCSTQSHNYLKLSDASLNHSSDLNPSSSQPQLSTMDTFKDRSENQNKAFNKSSLPSKEKSGNHFNTNTNDNSSKENDCDTHLDSSSNTVENEIHDDEDNDLYSDYSDDDTDIMSLSSVQDCDESITKHLHVMEQVKKQKLKAPRCLISNCNVRFKSVNTMSYHKKCHDKDTDKNWKCPECSKNFVTWHSLSVHLWNDHSIDMELYFCNFCSFRTPNLSNLKNSHIWIHGKSKIFNCSTCNKSFKTSKQLRNHQVIHKKNQVKYECKTCKALFNRCHLLRQHYDAVHQKVKKFKCSSCGHKSASQSAHNLHLRKHTKEKKYACGECNYSTGDHNALRRHLATHSGVRPYSCPHCGYTSISSKSLLNHVSSKHPGMLGDVVFSCPLCPFKTLRKEIFVAHATKHNLVQTSSNTEPNQNTSNAEV